MRTLRNPAALTVLLLVTACGGGGHHGGATRPAISVTYAGPAIPGLEAKPIWSLPNSAVVSSLGLGKTFAVVFGHQGRAWRSSIQGALEPDGSAGLNLATGKPAWKMKGVTFYSMFGDSVLTSNGDISADSQQLTLTDAATGRRIASSRVPVFDCHDSVFDKDSGSALCGSQRLGRTRLTALDSSTGKVRWQQPGPNARDLTPKAAAGGVAYLQASETGSDGNQTQTHLAVNDRNGQVLADNLPIDDIVMADNGIALVSYQDTLYGFRMKKTT
jgi:outer membrane protein assembly factor BamB